MRLIELLTTSRAQTTHVTGNSAMAAGDTSAVSGNPTAKTSPFSFSFSSPLSTLSKLLMDKTSMFRQSSVQGSSQVHGLPNPVPATGGRCGRETVSSNNSAISPGHQDRQEPRGGVYNPPYNGVRMGRGNSATRGTTYDSTKSAAASVSEAKMTHVVGSTPSIAVPSSSSSNVMDSNFWTDVEDNTLTFRDLIASDTTTTSGVGQGATQGADTHRRPRFSSVMSTGSSDESSSDLLSVHFSPSERRQQSSASSPLSDDWASGHDGGYSSVPWRDLNIDPLATIWPSLQLDEADQYGIDNLALFNFNDVGCHLDAGMDGVLSRDIATPLATSCSSSTDTQLIFCRSNSITGLSSNVDVAGSCGSSYSVDTLSSLNATTNTPVNTGNLLSTLGTTGSQGFRSPDTTTSEIMKLLLKSKLSPLSPTSCSVQPTFTEPLQTACASNSLGVYSEIGGETLSLNQLNAFCMSPNQSQQPLIYAEATSNEDIISHQNSSYMGTVPTSPIIDQIIGCSMDVSPQSYLLAEQGDESCTTIDASSILSDAALNNIQSISSSSSDQILLSSTVHNSTTSAVFRTSSSSNTSTATSAQSSRSCNDNITNSKLYELIVSNRTQDSSVLRSHSNQNRGGGNLISSGEMCGNESETQSAALKLLEERLKRQWKGMELKKKILEELKGEKLAGASMEYLRAQFYAMLKSQSDLNSYEIKREMEEIFPGTVTDHDYCQNVANKLGTSPDDRSFKASSSTSSANQFSSSSNSTASSSNTSRASENSALRNLLLDANLADEVRKQAAEDREKSRKRMLQKHKSCLSIPNPLLRNMVSPDTTPSCLSPDSHPDHTDVGLNNNSATPDLCVHKESQDQVQTVEFKDLDWRALLENFEVEIDDSCQFDNFISVDGEFSYLPVAENLETSANNYNPTLSEDIVYSNQDFSLPAEDRIENKEAFRSTDNIFNYNLMPAVEFDDISEGVTEKKKKSDSCNTDTASSTIPSVSLQAPASITKAKRPSQDLNPNDSAKLQKRQPNAKRHATVTAVNKNKSLNKMYNTEGNSRFSCMSACSNKL